MLAQIIWFLSLPIVISIAYFIVGWAVTHFEAKNL